MINNHCVRTVHAEINAVLNAARHGIAVKDARLYVTHNPCLICLKHIKNVGIREIIYKYEYPANTTDDRRRRYAETCEAMGFKITQNTSPAIEEFYRDL